MAAGQVLRQHPAEREPDHVDQGKAERADHVRGVIRNILDEGARVAGRRRTAPIILQDRLATHGQPICHKAGVPMIHAAAKMLKSRAAVPRSPVAPATISEAITRHLDEAGWCREMCVGHASLPSTTKL
jgi:hypothetical protein